MKVRLLSLAEVELLAGFRFYELQAPGLGDYFLDSIYADIDSLKLYAGIHRRVLGYHCLLAKRFPFAIYYEVSSKEVRVWHVLDCRRDPKWIRNALRT